MPTYDYVCLNCQKRFDVFMSYNEYGIRPVTCSHCGSQNVKRRVPRVRVARSDESRMESMTDDFSGFEGLDDDPQAGLKAIQTLQLPGTHLHQRGGIDGSPLAVGYGIHMPPHAFVVGKDGKVVNKNAPVLTLDGDLKPLMP